MHSISPHSRESRWLWWCFVAFAFSFAFDFRANVEFGAAETGGSPVQYLMLLLALGSGVISAIIGRRHLLATPGVYLLLMWWGYLGFSLGSALLQGGDPSRILRLMVAPVLIGLGMLVTHNALCSGTTPKRLIRMFLIVCVVNMVWQTLSGYAMSSKSLLETRPEISPGVRYLFAWLAVGLLLQKKFTFSPIVLGGAAIGICVLSLTRSAAIYLAAALAAAGVCMLLAILWRRLTWQHAVKRLMLSAAAGVIGFGLIFVFCMSIPVLRDWWIDRLFYSDGGGATTEDMSILMRKAEAQAMFELLNEDPLDYLWGRGYGSAYYWSPDYLPELRLVFNDRDAYPLEIYTAGHSLWTYSVFASGAIGGLAWLAMFLIPTVQSLIAARSLGGKRDDLHLICFAAVASLTMVGSSILENPYDNRLAGPLTGIVAAIPQYYLIELWRKRRRKTKSVAQAPIQSPPVGFGVSG